MFYSNALNICAQFVAIMSCKEFNLELAADRAHLSTTDNTI